VCTCCICYKASTSTHRPDKKFDLCSVRWKAAPCSSSTSRSIYGSIRERRAETYLAEAHAVYSCNEGIVECLGAWELELDHEVSSYFDLGKTLANGLVEATTSETWVSFVRRQVMATS